MAKKSSSRRSIAPRRGRTEAGQGMSISTIIVAAIGLIVLVVLVAIFTGQMGKWTGGVETQKTGVTCVGTSPKGLGGQWQSDPCTQGKELYGVTNTADVQQNAGKYCCKL